MNSDDKFPLSRNVATVSADDFWLTAAEWRNEYGSSYEIGIRRKGKSDEFYLLQGNWGEHNILKVAEAVKLLLNGGFTPTEIIREIMQ